MHCLSKLLLTVFILVSAAVAHAQPTAKFDRHLADSLGADKYGMKTYVLVILKTGEGKAGSKAREDSIFRGHLQNIHRLADAGKLIVAGPMFKNDRNYEGILYWM